ncbi:MAG: hypothetical protein J6D08_07890 [Lachnospiraceae bacterium]|nr:hypothetical protein [Lachnospiraceae bacterium]
MKSIRKKLSVLMMAVLLFSAMYIPVSAAELPEQDVATEDTTEVEVVVLSDDDIMPLASGSNYFSKITSKLNSLNGAIASSNLSSGSCSGTTRSITKVTVYCRVSSGSSSFDLVVTSPEKTVVTQRCGTSSTTYTLTGFNGEDPYGTWNVGISSNGTVSTVTATLKVYYDYE